MYVRYLALSEHCLPPCGALGPRPPGSRRARTAGPSCIRSRHNELPSSACRPFLLAVPPPPRFHTVASPVSYHVNGDDGDGFGGKDSSGSRTTPRRAGGAVAAPALTCEKGRTST